jgi:hypothetical protein
MWIGLEGQKRRDKVGKFNIELSVVLCAVTESVGDLRSTVTASQTFPKGRMEALQRLRTSIQY